MSLARGTNRQFYCTGVMIFNKTRQFFLFLLTDKHFLGSEMTSNSCDTSPLRKVMDEMQLTVLPS